MIKYSLKRQQMGTPIRIATMGRDIITLSDFTPDEDIEIKYIGLRPGEKLFEELITEVEGIRERPTMKRSWCSMEGLSAVSVEDTFHPQTRLP